MTAMLLAMTLGGATPDVLVVINETDVAASAGEQAIGLLRSRGYAVGDKAHVGELGAKKRKKFKRVVKLEVLRPRTCYVHAQMIDAATEKTLVAWQTMNDAEPCPEQIKRAVEALAAKVPPGN